MTPCDAPRCRDAARWAVGPDDRQLCRRHMLDALLTAGFGQAYAVPLAAEPLEAQPEPVAMLTAEEREAISAAACICEDAGRTDIAVVINTALERLG